MTDSKPISDIRVQEVIDEVGKISKPATVRIDSGWN